MIVLDEQLNDDRVIADCIICLKLTLDRKYEAPGLVRTLLSLPEFNTKQKRMGTIISWQDSGRIQTKTI